MSLLSKEDRAEWRKDCSEAVDDALDTIDALTAMLRQDEWLQESLLSEDDPQVIESVKHFCTVCLRDKPNHSPDCALAKLLREVD